MIRIAFQFLPASWRPSLVLAMALFASACGGGGGGGQDSQHSVEPPSQPTSPSPGNPAPGGDPVQQPPAFDPVEPWYPPADAAARTRDALRFLNQTTFGATKTDFAELQSIGYDAFLEKQFASVRTGYTGFTYLSTTAPAGCRTSASDPDSPSAICGRNNYTLFEVQRQFFVNAMTGEDQLRQRVAFALSQIFVVSGTDITHAAGMASYQNLLLDHAFGNYRDLLEAVTLHPVMGAYLDMVNNARTSGSRQANENYARECLQLFSLGLHELELDGSVRTDASGTPIAAYDQDVVSAMARAFTGWTYAPLDGAASKWTNPANFMEPMVSIDEQHDTASKLLFSGVTLLAGQSAQQDLDAALDAIFQHPNVGPFIAKRLIQHLVTSNPSADYVARVATVFANNGRGVRGDLRAVVRAILLDREARDDNEDEYDFGRLKDPALFMTGFLRALGGQSDGVYLRAQASAMGQNIFTPPSVFSYYSPANVIRGTELLGPEFGIYDSNRSLLRAEFAYQLLYAGGAKPAASVAGSTGTTVNLVPLEQVAAKPVVLLNELDLRMMNGRFSSAARDVVSDAMDAVSADDAAGRVRMAAYLLAVSPQFQVQR